MKLRAATAKVVTHRLTLRATRASSPELTTSKPPVASTKKQHRVATSTTTRTTETSSTARARANLTAKSPSANHASRACEW